MTYLNNLLENSSLFYASICVFIYKPEMKNRLECLMHIDSLDKEVFYCSERNCDNFQAPNISVVFTCESKTRFSFFEPLENFFQRSAIYSSHQNDECVVLVYS